MNDNFPQDPEEDVNLRQSTLWRYMLLVPIWLAATVLFLLMSMTFLDVILRSVFNNPIESATELTRLFMAILVFSALPMVSWKGENIVVDLFDPLFPAGVAKIRDILIDLSCGVLLIWPAMRIWDLAERSRRYGDVTEYLNMPQFYIGWFISIFTGYTALIFLVRGFVRLFTAYKDN